MAQQQIIQYITDIGLALVFVIVAVEAISTYRQQRRDKRNK